MRSVDPNIDSNKLMNICMLSMHSNDQFSDADPGAQHPSPPP